MTVNHSNFPSDWENLRNTLNLWTKSPHSLLFFRAFQHLGSERSSHTRTSVSH